MDDLSRTVVKSNVVTITVTNEGNRSAESIRLALPY